MLDPAGPSARAIASVWWWMFGVAAAVLAGVIALWLVAMRARRPHSHDEARRVGNRWIIGGGVLLPTGAIAALLLFGSPAGLHQLPFPGGASRPAPLRVDVTARQWAWEFSHPGTALRSRNELRIPAGRPVDLHVSSADVIHSFWVPRLGGKLDAIPGRTLVVRLQADQPGSYAGRCAEFCGTGHARMSMVVHALEPAAFDAWLAGGTHE